MRVNRLTESCNVHSIREMVEGFRDDCLSYPALTMKRGEGYWTLNYGETREIVRSLGNALLERGIRAGDRVGLISENRSEWVLTYLAVTCIGAVIVPYDILLKAEELGSIIRASGARMIVTSAEYFEKVGRALPREKGDRPVETLVLVDSVGVASAFRTVAWEDLVREGRQQRATGRDLYAAAVVAPNDLAALIFTSGTTGTPKGVMLSHRNLVENGDGVQITTILGPGDNWIIVLPFHHTYPTNMGIFTPLLTHAQIISVPSMKTNVLVGIMKDRVATCVPAMPLLIEKIYKGILAGVKAKPPLVRLMFRVLMTVSSFFFKVLHIRIGKLFFGSVARELGLQKLRFFVSGGGPISKQTIDGMEALGLVVYQGYGLTETSPVVSTSCPSHNRPGSVGVPLYNVEVKIENPDHNGNGEILTRGPHVMLGYYKMPEKTREVIDAEGWFHTGDIGKLDKEGFLYITGRLKNIIVTKGGKNIYPEEIENLLSTSPLLAEAVVIGKVDAEGGEYPHAIIYPDQAILADLQKEKGTVFTDEEVRQIVRTEIQKCTAGAAVYKIPHSFEISREELPKSSTQKVKRFMFTDAR